MHLREILELRAEWKAKHRAGDSVVCKELRARAQIEAIDAEMEKKIPENLRLSLTGIGREWDRRICTAALREGFRLYRIELGLNPGVINAFEAEVERIFSIPECWGVLLLSETREGGTITSTRWDAVLYFLIAPDRNPGEIGLKSIAGVIEPKNAEALV